MIVRALAVYPPDGVTGSCGLWFESIGWHVANLRKDQHSECEYRLY